MNTIYKILLIAFSCIPVLVFSQEISRDVISTQGNYFKHSNNLSLEWTLGELTVNSTNPCFFTDGFHQSFLVRDCGFNDPDGIPQDEDLHIYPNPALDDLFIEIEKGLIQDVIIYDNGGAHLRTFSYDFVPFIQLDLRFLSAGLYVIRITTDFKILNKKFIKID